MKLTDEQWHEAGEKFKLGITIPELAKEYNQNLATVYVHLKKRGYYQGYTHTSAEADKQIADLYKSGKAISSLAADFNLSNSAVLKSLKRSNTPSRRRGIAKKYSLDDTVFDSINEFSSYFAGFLMADGCIATPRYGENSVGLVLQGRDRELIEKFARFLKTDYPIYYTKRDGQFGVKVASNKLAKSLENWGVTPRKTFTAKIPEHLKDNRDFFRGLIDRDGWVTITKRDKAIGVVGTKDICASFQGFYQRKSGDPFSRVVLPCRGCYSVHISGKASLVLGDLLYKDSAVYLDRKYKKYQELIATRN